MVPVSQLNGKKTSRFALAAELIDPSVPELKGLCFDDEEIYPKERFFRNFNVALKGCGLKTAVDEAVVEHRILCYTNTKYPLSDIQERAQRLLKSACSWTLPLEELEDSDLRRLKWLPTVDLSGTLSLKASDECRGRRDGLLVSSQLPILPISISTEWEARLGWNNKLPSGILLSQLSFGIQSKDRKIVDAVLTYISQDDLTEPLANALMSLPCVLANSGLFVVPSQALRPPKRSIDGCERLEPYLANVDRKFWQDHTDLLTRLKVGDRLYPSDLLKVQARLEAKTVLEESDVAVAIEILNLASWFPRDSLAGLKAISETGEFYPLQDINFNDLGPVKLRQKVNLTHPEIPPSTIQRLGIGSLRERLIKGILEIEDVDDEDEFDQRENVTTRIADTLDRYPVESTFREYLANADDAKGASKISWLLDERVHPRDKLLTPEMELFQGPAFLVHNDGGKSSSIL
jgi:sacsin